MRSKNISEEPILRIQDEWSREFTVQRSDSYLLLETYPPQEPKTAPPPPEKWIRRVLEVWESPESVVLVYVREESWIVIVDSHELVKSFTKITRKIVTKKQVVFLIIILPTNNKRSLKRSYRKRFIRLGLVHVWFLRWGF